MQMYMFPVHENYEVACACEEEGKDRDREETK